MIPLDILEQEKARRECKPNEFTGVTPLLMKLNDKYRKVVPKLERLFTIGGICDDKPDQTVGYDFFPIVGGRGGTK